MEDNTGVLDFVKAVSDADRLRIIGVLSREPRTVKQVADELGMPFREAFAHLSQLEFAGVVHKTGDSFALNDGALERLSKQQFHTPRPVYVPDSALDEKTRKTLVAYLNADGSLKQLPTQPAKVKIILAYLVATFEPGRDYTEKQVNELLRRFHPDTATLRRSLVDAGLLSREGDGSRYWRTDRASHEAEA